MRENGYIIIYNLKIDKIRQSLIDSGIDDFIPLNNQSGVIYPPDTYDIIDIENIDGVTWCIKSEAMSSLIKVTDNIQQGVEVLEATGIVGFNNPYINPNGENVLVAIIDSGVDYLHPDFINSDGTSKIISIWNQEVESGTPPEGMSFGSLYSSEEINQAIQDQNGDLCKDERGTGTIAAGIVCSEGNIEDDYKGIATGSQLLVVKLREYKDTYSEGKYNYDSSDFLLAVSHILDVSKKLQKHVILNFSVGVVSSSSYSLSILNTFREFYRIGATIVSGAGNEGNTDIHFSGSIEKGTQFEDSDSQDIILQAGDDTQLDITINFLGADKVNVVLISPSTEVSKICKFTPENAIVSGKFNIENTGYTMRCIFPSLSSGKTVVRVNLKDLKPGVWTIRIIPKYIINGNYNIYIPNRDIISANTRFLDGNSAYTITRYGLFDRCITVGVYNEKTNSMWIGSSKGPHSENKIKPDIVASGVDIISTFPNNTYTTATGSGVSSSAVSGVLALIIEYISRQTSFPRYSLYNEPLKTYLMVAATRNSLYSYPNISQGYGLLNYPKTIIMIAQNIN